MTDENKTTESARRVSIMARLTQMTAELSGYDESDLIPTHTFLELGFDSLFLTQLATAFQKEFKVKVLFRQLFDEVPTLASLSDYIDAKLPVEAAPVEAPAPTAKPVAGAKTSGTNTAVFPMPSLLELPIVPGDTSAEGLAGIFAEQINLMTQQLQMLNAARAGKVAPGPVKSDAPTASIETTRSEEKPTPQLPKGFGPPQSTALTNETLTPSQRAHIDRLVARYNAKTAISKQRTQADRVHHADPRTAAGFNPLWKEMVYPIVVERSRGCHLWDADGNQYIDMLNGFGPNFFGHNAPFVTEALKGQLENGYEVGPQTPRAGEAAKLLCELTGMDRVSWVNTGSEAVQAAIRISRTVTGRDKIVVFSGDYHGNFDEVLVRGTKSAKGRRTYPLAPGIPFDAVSNVLVLDYGDMGALDEIKACADEIAAVLVEPIQSRCPELQPKEFLQALRKLTSDEEIVLIFDEVITGFRTCPGGAQEYFGVEADLATYGKIIGGGMPIGVVAGRARFMDTFDGGMWQYGDNSKPTAGVTFFAGTFVRHPLAMAAAHASLSYLKNAGPALQDGINRKATRLATTLTDFFKDQGVKIEVPHFASQMFIRNKEDNELSTLFFYHMRDRGIHLLEGFPTYMTAAHTDEDVDAVIAAAKDSIFEMQVDGILATPAGKTVTFRRQFELTDAQRHVWLACQMGDEASCAFNESDSVLIAGELDKQVIRMAVLDTLNHHEAFKIRFDPDGEYQWADDDISFDLTEIDLTGTSEKKAGELEKFFASEAQTPFDFERGSLARAHLISIGHNRYVFTIYCHHIVFDGYSAQLVIGEIMDRYNAAIAGAKYQPAETAPYSNFALVTASNPNDPAQQETRKYWSDIFADEVPALLDLPTDRARQAERQYTGSTVHRELSEDLSVSVKALARSLGVSQNGFLLAAFSALLSRLAAQEDFVIGLPAAGQAYHEIETVGYCVNMLPLRSKPAYGQSFAKFVKETQNTVMNAFDHQDLSFSDLLNDVQVPRHTGRLALTETVFNYSGYFSDLTLTGCKVSARENKRRAVYYDLFFNIGESQGKLSIDFDYATALFDEETIGRWIDHYAAVLQSIVQDPQTTIGALSLTAPDKDAWSVQGPMAELSETAVAFDAFEKAAAATPEATAVTCDGKSISYGGLRTYSNQLANWLAKKEIGEGDIVGIMLNRSIDMVASMLAVWKTGAAWLPLDPEYPAERLTYMITHAGTKLVISTEDLEQQTKNVSAPVLDLKAEISAIMRQANEIADPKPVVASSRAYVIYTSGSTGQPKGVENSHGALVNFLAAMKDEPGISADDKVLAVTTLSFDISLLELMLPLSVGAEVVIATQNQALDGFDLCDLLKGHKITLMQATPPTWRLMLDCDWQGTKGLKALCGGEPMTPALAEQLQLQVAELWNMYGPTETTVWSTCTRITDASDITVGRPVRNTVVYVLDEHKRPVPTGVPGELWIGGDGVALGYIGQPDLTGERFIEDPFVLGKTGTMYRTGDRAILRADGAIEMRGRRDNQVKVRGHRIELGEIESVLSRNEALREAVVVVHEDHTGEPMLAAYVVFNDNAIITHSDLRQWLRQSLPDYMIPQVFTEMDKLPLTGNNKIDRNALPDPVSLRLIQSRIAPRTEREQQIATLWEEILEIQDISVTDNFFELGGQSLQVAKMAAVLRKMHGYRISPRAVIFETLEQLAASVDKEAS